LVTESEALIDMLSLCVGLPEVLALRDADTEKSTVIDSLVVGVSEKSRVKVVVNETLRLGVRVIDGASDKDSVKVLLSEGDLDDVGSTVGLSLPLREADGVLVADTSSDLDSDSVADRTAGDTVLLGDSELEGSSVPDEVGVTVSEMVGDFEIERELETC
jgi:hypothetical protein